MNPKNPKNPKKLEDFLNFMLCPGKESIHFQMLSIYNKMFNSG